MVSVKVSKATISGLTDSQSCLQSQWSHNHRNTCCSNHLSSNQAPLGTMINKIPWKGRRPTLRQHFRESLGRALRETGQAMDRAGQVLESLTWLPDKYVGADPPVKYQDFLSRHRQQMPMLHCGKPVVSPDVAFLAPCATLIGSVRVHEGASIWYGAILRADACYNADSFNKTDEEILESEQQTMLSLDDGMIGEDAEEEKIHPQISSSEDDEREKLEIRKNSQAFGITDKNRYDDGGAIYVGKNTNLQDGVVVTARESSTVLGEGVIVGHLAQLHSSTVEDFALIGMGSILNAGSHVETEALVAAGAVIPANTRVKAGELWVGSPARKVRDLTSEERQKLHYQSSEYVKVALTHPMKLGDNIKMPWQDALLDYIENEPDVHERIAEMNKWNNTVYGYLTKPKPKNPELRSGEGSDQDREQMESGNASMKSEQLSGNKEQAGLEADTTADEAKLGKDKHQVQPELEVAQEQVKKR